MSRLLKADFRKLFTSKSFWVCAIIILLLGMVNVAIIELVTSVVDWTMKNAEMTVEDMISMQASLSLLPSDAWGITKMSFSDTNLAIMMSIAMMLFITGEYTSGTFKNTVARGFSRTSIYFSKLTVSLVIMVIFAVLYVASGTILAGILWGKWGEISAETVCLTLLINTVELVALTTTLTMMLLLFKSNGAAIAVILALIMFLPSILNVLTVMNMDLRLGQYWIPSTPGYTEIFVTEGQIWIPLVISAAYLIIPTIIGVLTFKKRDLK